MTPALVPLSVGEAYLEPLAGIGGEGTPVNVGFALLQPLESRNSRSGGVNYLHTLTAFAGSGAYAYSRNNFEPFVTAVESGLFTPTYALSAAALPYLHTSAHGITDEVGTSTANLVPLTTLSADHAYGISVNDFYPLVTLAGAAWPIDGYLIANLPGGYRVVSSGYQGSPSGLNARLPQLTLSAFTGGSVQRSLPMLSLSASGTVTVVGRVDSTLPVLTLVANGKAGGVSAVYLQHGGRYEVASHTGAHTRLAHAGRYSVSAAGLVGGIGSAYLSVGGRYTLRASTSSASYAVADMELPALQPAPQGQAWLVGPSLTMHASGGEVVAVTYEAYAINLTTGAVTHYTNYPFDNILRFGSHYYGVAPGGMYRLGGALDIDVQIDARVKTFQTSLGTKNQKRVPYVYASGRSDQGVTIGVTADEGTTYEYESAWGEVAGTANHRVKAGNGIRGTYYSLDVKNTDGGSLELDELSVHVIPTTRAV